MTIAGRFEVKAILVLGLAFSCCVAEATLRRGLVGAAGPTDFNVNSYGAKADGKTDNVEAFMKAWVAACKSGGGPARLVFPKGTYVTGPVVFAGPCKASKITVEVQGTIKATTDISEYTSPEWILFESISGLTLTGGIFDGRGETAWKYNDCHQNSDCQLLPSSIKFSKLTNTVVHGITSLNSKSFHTHVNMCQNFKAYDLTITAPSNSPNTDGMHISSSNLVNVSNSVVGTGDDCISIGQGVTNLGVTNITCGPGHGISVGSLGKYDDEKDVSRVVVSNCTLRNTTNGVRIKTYSGSPPSKASGITFQDIIMDVVKNPIIIDQKYGSHKSAASKVQISGVHYKNIVGTSTSEVAVSLLCSSQVPCEVELVDIDLKFQGSSNKGKSASSSCLNAKVKTGGKLNPPACR
ncbi:hypothetical protein SO802_033258 [Lithocarpus litseifolius]|uniref:Exopolygalacturonase-like n=1 Tax=Lithocarpus litseifolius TaxID=425828 RepID=A0AAW2BEA3_9ROSI